MTIKATKFRQNLYSILDSVLESGAAVEIERNGRRIRLVPDRPSSVWDRLEAHDCLNGDPEDLVSIDWSREWDEGGDR